VLALIRWGNGIYCPHYCAESPIRYGSNRLYQLYMRMNYGQTFNDKTGTVFGYSRTTLRERNLSCYIYIRLNASIRQLDTELAVTYKRVYWRVQRFLQAPHLNLISTARWSSTNCKYLQNMRSAKATIDRAHVAYPLVDVERTKRTIHWFSSSPTVALKRRTFTGKNLDKSTIRLLLSNRQQESLTDYNDRFRAYDPLDEDDSFDWEYVIHGKGEYSGGDVHINICESRTSLARRWLSSHRGVSNNKPRPYHRGVQLHRRVRSKPDDKALKIIIESAL